MSDEVIIGLDPSSKRLAAVVTRGDVLLEVWAKTLPEAGIDVRCDWAERHIRQLVGKYTKDGSDVYLFVEEPVVGIDRRSTIVQSQVRGAVLVGARRVKVKEIHGANNSRWKKVVVGTGRATKTDIKKHVMQYWPVLYKMVNADEDLCDAACINIYGKDVLRMKARIDAHRAKDEAGA